jgi:hypothetical protein
VARQLVVGVLARAGRPGTLAGRGPDRPNHGGSPTVLRHVGRSVPDMAITAERMSTEALRLRKRQILAGCGMDEAELFHRARQGALLDDQWLAFALITELDYLLGV